MSSLKNFFYALETPKHWKKTNDRNVPKGWNVCDTTKFSHQNGTDLYIETIQKPTSIRLALMIEIESMNETEIYGKTTQPILLAEMMPDFEWDPDPFSEEQILREICRSLGKRGRKQWKCLHHHIALLLSGMGQENIVAVYKNGLIRLPDGTTKTPPHIQKTINDLWKRHAPSPFMPQFNKLGFFEGVKLARSMNILFPKSAHEKMEMMDFVQSEQNSYE